MVITFLFFLCFHSFAKTSKVSFVLVGNHLGITLLFHDWKNVQLFVSPPNLQSCCRCHRCRYCRHHHRPAFADPFIGWLLCCCPPSAFIITCCHATVNALNASHFCHQSLSTAATAATAATAKAVAAAGPPPPSLAPPWSNSPPYIDKERGSHTTTTSVPTAAPLWKRLQVHTTWPHLTYT